MEWGAEIEVNGVRPAWLADYVRIDWEWSRSPGKWHADIAGNYPNGIEANRVGFVNGVARIRLPADHFAYTALAAGLEPWSGGGLAPKDWNGADVLLRDGRRVEWQQYTSGWLHQPCDGDIIGYPKKRAPIEGDIAAIAQSCLKTCPGYVAVKSLTEAEALKRFDWDRPVTLLPVLRDLGLIRQETRAEQFARETGHEVTPAVEAALAWDRAA